MALSDSAFKSVLQGIFDDMWDAADGTPRDNAWLAEKLAGAIDDQIKTADVLEGIAVATVAGGLATVAKGKIE
jgi:hypothetical protein